MTICLSGRHLLIVFVAIAIVLVIIIIIIIIMLFAVRAFSSWQLQYVNFNM
jgi:hypothetical protein